MAIYAMISADSILFQPQSSSYQDDAQILKLTTSDGIRISTMHLPQSGAAYTILFSHGNAEDIGDNLEFFEMLHKAGFSVFAYDYHGYGTSAGKPSEANAYRDIHASYDYLTGTLHIPPEKIIAYGRSVGSGPTVQLALEKPLAGMVLESGFLSAFRVIMKYPVLPGDRFKNLEKISKVYCPVLMMHGKQDTIIPFYHGETLFRLANEPKKFVPIEKAGHNDLIWVGEEEWNKALREFAGLIATHAKK